MSAGSEPRIIAELGDGICIAKVELADLREQDLNARVMDDAKFNQLVENIGKRGTLEQLPYCALTDRGIEIVSGNHRVRAARKAGLKETAILLDRSGLSRSAIAAKQLAHNSIEGTDDQDVLRQIASTITDVDEMLETALGQDYFKKVQEEAEKMPLPKVSFDWKTVQFTFLPTQVADLDRLVDATPKADYEGVAPLELFDGFAEALRRTERFEDVRNVGTAVHAMVKMALGEFPEDLDGYATIASVFGRAVIPQATADRLRAMIEKAGLKDEPWRIFDLLAGEDGQS